MKKYLEGEKRWQLSVLEFISSALRASREVLIDLFPVAGNNTESLRLWRNFSIPTILDLKRNGVLWKVSHCLSLVAVKIQPVFSLIVREKPKLTQTPRSSCLRASLTMSADFIFVPAISRSREQA
jgi:hypothetical protein